MIKKIKRNLYLKLSKKNGNSKGLEFMQLVNRILFHWKDRMHLVHLGENDKDKTYYVIRPSTRSEGLLSLYFNNGIKNVLWAREQGYIPYIDYNTNDCQYHVDRVINGTNNAWEYYFKQPSTLTSNDLKNKNNVLLSGWTVKQRPTILSREAICSSLFQELCQGDYAVQPYILQMAEDIAKEQLIHGKTLGVFLRGTDYVALKPSGHYKQPTVEQVMCKIDEFKNKYDIQKILVVTEDYGVFQSFKEKYGDIVFSSDDDFVKDYKDIDYVENAFNDDPYERGLKYLIRLLLLTRCDYLISSITNGSLFVLAEKQGEYVDEYLFDIGRYD